MKRIIISGKNTKNFGKKILVFLALALFGFAFFMMLSNMYGEEVIVEKIDKPQWKDGLLDPGTIYLSDGSKLPAYPNEYLVLTGDILAPKPFSISGKKVFVNLTLQRQADKAKGVHSSQIIAVHWIKDGLHKRGKSTGIEKALDKFFSASSKSPYVLNAVQSVEKIRLTDGTVIDCGNIKHDYDFGDIIDYQIKNGGKTEILSNSALQAHIRVGKEEIAIATKNNAVQVLPAGEYDGYRLLAIYQKAFAGRKTITENINANGLFKGNYKISLDMEIVNFAKFLSFSGNDMYYPSKLSGTLKLYGFDIWHPNYVVSEYMYKNNLQSINLEADNTKAGQEFKNNWLDKGIKIYSVSMEKI